MDRHPALPQLLVPLLLLGSALPLAAQESQPAARRLDRLTNGSSHGAETRITGKVGEGIQIRSGDTFALGLRSWVQPRYRLAAQDAWNPASNGGSADRSHFTLAAARTEFRGFVFDPKVEYQLTAEWTESNAIEDAWLRWSFWKGEQDTLALRFGQQKTLYGRQATAGDDLLEFVDRALATRNLANARARGALLTGEHAQGLFHWSAGLFNSDTASASSNAGEDAANPDQELNAVFSVRLDPEGDLGDERYAEGDLEHSTTLRWSVGAGLQLGNHRTVLGATTIDADGRDLNLNAALRYQGVHALGEVFLRSDEPDAPSAASSDAQGWQVGGTYTLARASGRDGQFSFGGRYSMLTLDDAAQTVMTNTPLGSSRGDVRELTALVGYYYKAHRLKLQGGWTLQEVRASGSPDATNHIFEIQLHFTF